jgi:hypothetical protein
LVWGCEPGAGVNAASKLIEDVIDLYRVNFHPELGCMIIPDVFSKVISSDARFEVLTCVEAKKLVIEREDDVVGHKRLIFAIDKDLKSDIELLKNTLGITD